MTKDDLDYIIVKNKEGNRKRVKLSDYNRYQEINETASALKGYEFDLDWYLQHGHKEINKMFADIENGIK